MPTGCFVTSKYLSAVCKENSGETASDLITCYVMKDIVCLLKSPDKSIKEIANELNFATLSFFGKYCKKEFRTFPKEYREKLSQQEGKCVINFLHIYKKDVRPSHKDDRRTFLFFHYPEITDAVHAANRSRSLPD